MVNKKAGEHQFSPVWSRSAADQVSIMSSCTYGDSDPCCHLLCKECGECLRTAAHKQCMIEYERKLAEREGEPDLKCHEVLEDGEPCEEWYYQVRENTPEPTDEDETPDEDAEVEALTWHLHKEPVTVKEVGRYLKENYPSENFNSRWYKDMSIPVYLSDEMCEFQFFIRGNESGFGLNMLYNIPEKVKMRTPVILNDGGLMHTFCRCKKLCGNVKGFMTIECASVSKAIELVRDYPKMFFCEFCNKFLYNTMQDFTDNGFSLPDEKVWPKCEFFYQSCEVDENNGAVIMVERTVVKLCNTCTVPEPAKKKQKTE